MQRRNTEVGTVVAHHLGDRLVHHIIVGDRGGKWHRPRVGKSKTPIYYKEVFHTSSQLSESQNQHHSNQPLRPRSNRQSARNKGMPPATIDEAETAFIRRKFVRSLRLANSILESGSSSDEPACAGRAAGKGQEEDGQVHDATVKPKLDAVDGNNVIVHCHSTLIPGRSLGELKKNTVANPAGSSSSPRSATDPPASTDTCTDSSSSSWSVRLTDESSVYDRAAAIVIQSIYEMNSAGGDGSAGEVEESRNEHIISDLSTLHRYYSQTTMPIGLACIYIQFCSTLGWRGGALSFALDILGHIFELDAPMQEELLSKDWFLDACEELIDLVLTELLPRVEGAEDCKVLLYQLMGRNEASDNSSHKTLTIAISEEVQPSSVDVLVRTLTGIGSNLSSSHPCLVNIFEQCGENLAQMQSALGSSYDSLNGDFDGVVRAADKASARSAAAATDTLDEHAHEDSSAGASQSLSEIFQSSIVEPLWESEDRWTNRAAVAAVGISSVLLWRRRKRIGAAVRSTGNAAVAPFREILEAISQPQGQKR